MEEGLQDKKSSWPIEAKEGKEIDSPLRGSRRDQPCQHLDFSPVKVILDF